MKFEVNEAGWRHEFQSVDGVLGQWLEERAIYLMVLARRQIKDDSGRLSDSIRWTLSYDATGLVATVGSPLKYALPYHNGTREHPITPTTVRALRFAQDGKIVFARIVNHPATAPNRYLTDNLPKIFDKTN